MLLGRGWYTRNRKQVHFLFVVFVFLTLQLWYTYQPCIHDPVPHRFTNFTTNPVSPMATSYSPFKLNNKHICNVKPLKMLVLVHSATRHFDRRVSFRETWANTELFSGKDLRVVFVLGATADEMLQTQIEAEGSQYGDIVQGDFIDAYVNLTHKAITGLRWVADHCSQAQFIVKVDDDVFLNVFQLFQLITSDFQFKQRSIWCHMLPERTDVIPRSGTKWDVAKSEFQNYMCYPFAFCRGYAVIFTADLVTSLFEESKTTPFFHLDDVFVYGMLATRVGNVRHESLAHLSANETDSMQCFLHHETCDNFVSRVDQPTVMNLFWNRIVSERKMQSKYKMNANKGISQNAFSFPIFFVCLIFCYTSICDLVFP